MPTPTMTVITMATFFMFCPPTPHRLTSSALNRDALYLHANLRGRGACESPPHTEPRGTPSARWSCLLAVMDNLDTILHLQLFANPGAQRVGDEGWYQDC